MASWKIHTCSRHEREQWREHDDDDDSADDGPGLQESWCCWCCLRVALKRLLLLLLLVLGDVLHLYCPLAFPLNLKHAPILASSRCFGPSPSLRFPFSHGSGPPSPALLVSLLLFWILPLLWLLQLFLRLVLPRSNVASEDKHGVWVGGRRWEPGRGRQCVVWVWVAGMERREGRGESGGGKGARATVRPQRGHVLQVSEIRVTQSDESQTTTRTAKQEETHEELDFHLFEMGGRVRRKQHHPKERAEAAPPKRGEGKAAPF